MTHVLSGLYVNIISLVAITLNQEESIMAKVLNFSLEVSKFKLQSHYDVYFRTNILGKGMKSLIPTALG